ncbi:MAG: hypothetical protein JSV79_02495 [Armatimonadota bacterium]|nr:MAG: hypothetical protein JSV79_02495 [Armatimonadota bacterium]
MGAAATPRLSGLAVASVVLALVGAAVGWLPTLALGPEEGAEYLEWLSLGLPVGLALGLGALGMGLIAIVRIRRRPQRFTGMGLAIAGIVIAALGSPLSIGFLFVALPVAVASGGLALGIIVLTRRVRQEPAGARKEQLLESGETEAAETLPPINRLAVLACCLGLSGVLLATLSLAFVADWREYGGLSASLAGIAGRLLGMAGIALGIVAVIQIGRRPDQYRGLGYAVVGMVGGAAAEVWLLAWSLIVLAPVAVILAFVWLGIRMSRRRVARGPDASTDEAELPRRASRLPALGLTLAVLGLPISIAGMLYAVASRLHPGGATWAARILSAFPVVSLTVSIVALVLGELRGAAGRGRALAVSGIAVSFLVGYVVLMAYPVLLRENVSAHKAVCLSNVKNLTLALQMYLEDSGDVFPPSAGWCESVEPYIQNEDVFRCPAAKVRDLACAYAYNTSVAGVPLERFVAPADTVAIFESDAGWNAAGGRELLAEEPRHLRGDNLGFADRHAAWCNRQRLLSQEEAALRWGPE